MDVKTQQEMLKEIFNLISRRPDHVCNFLEGSALLGGQDTKIIYRHYATLYFVFVVDSSESELGILDLIQVFVESLDRSFSNVCELDLIFRPDEVMIPHNLIVRREFLRLTFCFPQHQVSEMLSEVISGGLVLETNIHDIIQMSDTKKAGVMR
ncbi:AP-3 complex subunit sigma-1 [Rhizophlyctis rosea]|uniref:AP complex subunit sigma n=1 Tax=Rhizophlyctis rosea TaxID=64517 RepID=A0AAD5S229_9FUNG|nr:AP-3 complex subunit sigma-1 [Rhizophlyctis rosea]